MSKLKSEYKGKKIWCPINNSEILISDENESILVANGHYHLFKNGGSKGDLKPLTKTDKKAEIAQNPSTQNAVIGTTLSKIEFLTKLSDASEQFTIKAIKAKYDEFGVTYPKRASKTKLIEIAKKELDAEAS